MMINLHAIYIPIIILLLAVLLYFAFRPKTKCPECHCSSCIELNYRLDVYSKPIEKIFSIDSKSFFSITPKGLEYTRINPENKSVNITTIIPITGASKFRSNFFGQLEIIDSSDKVLSSFPQIKPFQTYIPYYIYLNNNGKLQAINSANNIIWQTN